MRVLLLLLSTAAAVATTYRVSGSSAFGVPLWTMPGEYPDITVRQGDSVVFLYRQGYHDVAVIPTQAAWNSCDLSAVTTYALLNGSVAASKPGTSVVDPSGFVTYTYVPQTIGQVLFVCSVGSHCLSGQKVTINVVVASGPAQTVNVASKADVWVVGNNYANLTVNLGDTLEFRSNDEHNVALVPTSAFATCDATSAQSAIEWKETALTLRSWKPTTAGDFYVICSIPLHCLYGQKFKVTVRTPSVSSGSRQWINTSQIAIIIFALVAALA
eukprot:TRINITY_DN25841_c0_g1_i1.p1 TRINITY_DN25841_c0_g1~~TRINITY_DN25841_c0_g1_i1.p1  ORF type:complete len:271 (+),score=34.55 TRINITY_DN25841_c0_g1_i1:35-847(+)